RALPTSQGLGITKQPVWCKARNLRRAAGISLMTRPASSCRLVVDVQSLGEIGDQVSRALQADVQPDDLAAIVAAITALGELRVADDGQALETAPGEAKTE